MVLIVNVFKIVLGHVHEVEISHLINAMVGCRFTVYFDYFDTKNKLKYNFWAILIQMLDNHDH